MRRVSLTEVNFNEWYHNLFRFELRSGNISSNHLLLILLVCAERFLSKWGLTEINHDQTLTSVRTILSPRLSYHFAFDCSLHRHAVSYRSLWLSLLQPQNQAVSLLNAVAYLKVPLIFVNALIIVVELIFGWIKTNWIANSDGLFSLHCFW